MNVDFCSVGAPHQIGDELFITTERGETGFVVFGPYKTYKPGKYFVTFTVIADLPQSRDDDVLVGGVDVVSDEGRLSLAQTTVFATRSMRTGGTIVLPFELFEPRALEFRVRSTGQAPLKVKFDRPVESDPQGTARYTPVLPLNARPPNRFLSDHFDHLRHLYDHGVEFDAGPDGVTARLKGILLNLVSGEDLQVLREVFISNDYNVQSGKDRMVVDIGMNVGITSLFLASDPHTKKVYGFEPFANPFERARINFGLNPDLSAKIVPLQIGLSNRSFETTVQSQLNVTIGTSILGTASGVPEVITIRDAAEVFAPIIAEASAGDLQLVVKIDCEGSEFDIFETLVRHRLLDRVDVFMIEWHKWWSIDKTQHYLTAPLKAADFVVFDRTSPGDQYAGTLYAVRR